MINASPRPELLALLAAVKADPDDNMPKLALADWLQEQDDEHDRARGEFLREHVRLRQLPPDETLADTTSSLWQQHHEAWFGPLRATGFWNNWHRWGLLIGCIDGTKLVAKKGLALAGTEVYAWLAGLAFDRLSNTQLRKFHRSPLLDTLIGLQFEGCNVYPSILAELVASPRAAGLRFLEIGKIAAPAPAIAASPHMARLRELRLWQARVADAGFKALCDSPHLNELRSLHVPNGSLTIHAARAFAEAKGLPAVTDLNLGGTNRIGPDGTLILAASPKAGQLRKLNLWSNGIADYGVEAICNQKHIDKLTHLDVSGNLLTNRAAVALAAAAHLKTLEELHLTTNTISGEGALAAGELPAPRQIFADSISRVIALERRQPTHFASALVRE